MAPRRDLALGMFVQASGAAATFATGVVIAWAMGPVSQGRYGLMRTAAELLLMVALLGLPQSLVHAIHHEGASPSLLARACGRYGLWLLLASVGGALLLLVPLPGSPSARGQPLVVLALAIAVCGWLVQGLWRALVLVVGGPLQFAWTSVLPALTLFVAVVAAVVLDSQKFEWAMAASGVASLLLAAWQLRILRQRQAWRAGNEVRLSGLAVRSVLAMTQTVAFALQPWLTLMLLQLFGAGADVVGLFVFASLVQQAFVVPASFMAPLLMERVSRAAGAGASYSLRQWLPMVAWAAGAAVVVALLLPWGVPAAFGAEYEAAVPACVWMAISGPFVVSGRLVAAVLFGRGAFRASALQAMSRAVAVPLAVVLALGAMPHDRPMAAAMAWAIVEAFVFGLGAVLVVREVRKAA